MNKPAGQDHILCVILGGGGHAQVLIDCLQVNGIAVPYAVLDINRALWGTDLLGVPVRGGDNLLQDLVREGVNCFAVGMGAIGDNRPRQRLFELGLAHHLEPLTIIHPAAICSRHATVGRGSQLFPGSIVNAGAKLGENVIVNSGAIVEHDCVIGSHAHIATGARMASTVHVGEGSHIGVGASVRQCVNIGKHVIVGAGAVVVADVADETTVIGVPARPYWKKTP